MSDQTQADASHPGSPMSAADVLEREYLEMRSLILRLAASFDRMERSQSPKEDNEKRERLEQGVQILLDQQGNKAERVQKLFSLAYHSNWHQEFGLQIEK